MSNKLRSIGLVSAILFLSACGGGGGGQTSSASDQLIVSSTDTPAAETPATETPVANTPAASTPVVDTSTGDTVAIAGNRTLSLQWVAPAARVNGDSLSLSEIDSYTVYFGTSVGDYPYSVAIKNTSSTKLDIPGLPADTYYLVITATDRAGRESSYSRIVVKEVT